MKRLQIRNAKTMAYLFQAEIQRTDDSRYDHRLHGVLLVSQGLSCSAVAKLFDHTPKTIENWVNLFNSGGFIALKGGKRTGRRPKLSSKQEEQINKDIRLDPLTLGYDQNLWDGKLLSHHITLKFKISLSVRQCQRLFHKYNFRQRKPRPMSSKGDPIKQEDFKKNQGSFAVQQI